MFLSFFQVFIPVLALVFNVLVQVVGFRYTKIPLLKSLVLGFFIGFIFVIGTESCSYFVLAPSVEEFVALFTVNFLTYSALGYCYFHFINLGEGARRIRIIRELLKYENGLSMDELLKIYNARTMVRLRIDRLLASKQIVLKDGRYFIGKPIMLFISQIILLMKIVIIGKRSEFD